MSTPLDVLKAHGVDCRDTGNPDEYIITCPKPECARPKLYVNVEKRLFTCFRCGESGTIRKLFRLLGIDQKQEFAPSFDQLRQKAAAAIAARTGEELLPESDGTSPLPPEFREINSAVINTSAVARAAYEYLVKRDVTGEMIEKWKLGYCEGGKYSGFCIIPVFDHLRNPVSFQARRVAGIGQKSLNPPGGDKFLFNIENAMGSPGLLVVEGPFDAMMASMRLQRGGLPISAVALLGHSCSTEQAEMISRVIKPEMVWVALDPDVPVIEMHKVGSTLRMNGNRDVRVALLPRDPDEMLFDELADRLDVAEPALPLRKT